jgi:Na+-driven multidrug efflux pump
MFNKDPEIVKYGVEMVRFTVYSTIFIGWSHIYNGVCRGAGNVKLPMIIAIFSQVIVRYVYVTIAFSISTSIYHVYVGSSIGFVVAGIVASIYFNFGKWTKEHHLRP